MQHSFKFQFLKPASFLGAVAAALFLSGALLSSARAADRPAPDKTSTEKPATDKPATDKPNADVVKEEVKKRTETNQDELSSSQRRLKRTMASFGVENEEDQDNIIAHVKEEVWAHAKIREQVGHLYYALRNKKTSDETLKQLTNELNTMIAADQQRRKEADKRLDRKVKYSENPRMEAMLMMFGIIGDGPMMTDINPPRRPEKKD